MNGARAGRVVVVGSVNVDHVFRLDALPAPGETVLALDSLRTGGGKGGNQACAASRWGAATSFVGSVGRDEDGEAAEADLRRWEVELTGLSRSGAATGRALILVDRAGENSIVVSPGANATLTPEEVTAALGRLGLGVADVVLTCGEVPTEVVAAAARSTSGTGTLHVHNVAPARAEDAAAAPRALLVLNEVELAQVTPGAGPDPVTGLVRLARGRPGAVLTRGGAGAVVFAGEEVAEVAAPRAEVVDTTGAGDTFCGVLAAELAAGHPLVDSVRSAVLAGSYAVTGLGARGALPRRDELVPDP